MQNFTIQTDESGKELIEHGKPWYPIAGYDEHFSMFTLKEVPLHWHSEIELIIVKEGATKVHLLSDEIVLHSGQGIFINNNVLHRLTQISDIDCHIINFVLNPEFIGGKSDTQIYQKYIRPICKNENIDAIKFTPDIPWNKSAIGLLNDAFEYYSINNFGNEMLVRSKLTEFWYVLCKYSSDYKKNESNEKDLSEKRLESAIKFVHKHIDEKLSIQEIADAAFISESECFRIFRKKMSMTPMDYVLSHRLQLAATYLKETSESILNIAVSIGFGSSSYFSKKFKEHYGITPKTFRNKN